MRITKNNQNGVTIELTEDDAIRLAFVLGSITEVYDILPVTDGEIDIYNAIADVLEYEIWRDVERMSDKREELDIPYFTLCKKVYTD